jgi:hypothetical protein
MLVHAFPADNKTLGTSSAITTTELAPDLNIVAVGVFDDCCGNVMMVVFGIVGTRRWLQIMRAVRYLWFEKFVMNVLTKGRDDVGGLIGDSDMTLSLRFVGEAFMLVRFKFA